MNREHQAPVFCRLSPTPNSAGKLMPYMMSADRQISKMHLGFAVCQDKTVQGQAMDGLGESRRVFGQPATAIYVVIAISRSVAVISNGVEDLGCLSAEHNVEYVQIGGCCRVAKA